MREQINAAAFDTTRGVYAPSEDELCRAAGTVLTFLRKLKDHAGGWKFWLRYALGLVIGILETLIAERCPAKEKP